jgi:hypothetical protein
MMVPLPKSGLTHSKHPGTYFNAGPLASFQFTGANCSFWGAKAPVRPLKLDPCIVMVFVS